MAYALMTIEGAIVRRNQIIVDHHGEAWLFYEIIDVPTPEGDKPGRIRVKDPNTSFFSIFSVDNFAGLYIETSDD